VLNSPVIARKLEAHYRGDRDYSVEVFNWLTLELWCRRFQSGTREDLPAGTEEFARDPAVGVGSAEVPA
jgi:hypothetical protein